MIPTEEAMYRALEERHGKELQKRFASASVAVCGLGGLGSHIAFALARAGIGRLILIDFDKVEITNLNRQQYKADQIGLDKTEALKRNLKEIAPYVQTETFCEKLTEKNIPELLKEADIVCEAFDDPESKALLTDTVLSLMKEKYLVAASGMAGLDSGNIICTRKITDHFYLCGDGVSEVTDGMGLVSARVMLCAAHQAHMVLRILAGRYDA